MKKQIVGLSILLLTLASFAASKDRKPQQVSVNVVFAATSLPETLVRTLHVMCYVDNDHGKTLTLKVANQYTKENGKWAMDQFTPALVISRGDNQQVISDITWITSESLQDKVTDATVYNIDDEDIAHFGQLKLTLYPSQKRPHSTPGFKATCEGDVLDYGTDNNHKLSITPRKVVAANDQEAFALWTYTKKGQVTRLDKANGAMTLKEVLAKVPSIK